MIRYGSEKNNLSRYSAFVGKITVILTIVSEYLLFYGGLTLGICLERIFNGYSLGT